MPRRAPLVVPEEVPCHPDPILSSPVPHALSPLPAPAFCGACGGGGGGTPAPAAPAVQTVSVTVYPATAPRSGTTAATQDLLTGGLGKTGIGAAAAPAYADPLNPTALELRRNALYSNYRGLVDSTADGGYGTLYGPNVDGSRHASPRARA